MAGLRLGYAIGQPDVIARLSRWTMPYNGNALAVAAGVASIEDEAQIERERRRNTEALKFTTDFFRNAGFKTSDSQANFVWVNLRRPGSGVLGRLRKAGHPRRTRLPALREDAQPGLDRHDGRDAAGRRRVQERARADDDNGGRKIVGPDRSGGSASSTCGTCGSPRA